VSVLCVGVTCDWWPNNRLSMSYEWHVRNTRLLCPVSFACFILFISPHHTWHEVLDWHIDVYLLVCKWLVEWLHWAVLRVVCWVRATGETSKLSWWLLKWQINSFHIYKQHHSIPTVVRKLWPTVELLLSIRLEFCGQNVEICTTRRHVVPLFVAWLTLYWFVYYYHCCCFTSLHVDC